MCRCNIKSTPRRTYIALEIARHHPRSFTSGTGHCEIECREFELFNSIGAERMSSLRDSESLMLDTNTTMAFVIGIDAPLPTIKGIADCLERDPTAYYGIDSIAYDSSLRLCT